MFPLKSTAWNRAKLGYFYVLDSVDVFVVERRRVPVFRACSSGCGTRRKFRLCKSGANLGSPAFSKYLLLLLLL